MANKGTRTPIAIFALRASPPLLEDPEPEDVGLVVVGDGSDELLALVEEIVELPEEVFALVDEVVVLDDGVVVLVDDDRAAPRSERISESLASWATKIGFT
jgi:hypothetical protein